MTEKICSEVNPEYTQSAFAFYNQQWKEHNIIQTMFKVNNSNTKTTSIMLF